MTKVIFKHHHHHIKFQYKTLDGMTIMLMLIALIPVA